MSEPDIYAWLHTPAVNHPHCFSCRFWLPPRDQRYANFNPNCGQCINPRLKQPMLEPDAASMEGDEYRGTLWCGPDFYCKHHEAH